MENLIDYLIYALMGYDVRVKASVSGVTKQRQWMLSFGYHQEVSIILDEADLSVIKEIAANRVMQDDDERERMRNYLNCANDMEDFRKNAHGWKATKDDYRLIFREVEGLWVEITNNLPQFYNMTLADYLIEMNLIFDEDCQFCRIRRGDERWEFRNNGGYIRIDYDLIR